MAIIKKLKENELIGGTDNTDVYPITHTKAVFNSNGISSDEQFNSINNSINNIGYDINDINEDILSIRNNIDNIEFNVGAALQDIYNIYNDIDDLFAKSLKLVLHINKPFSIRELETNANVSAIYTVYAEILFFGDVTPTRLNPNDALITINSLGTCGYTINSDNTISIANTISGRPGIYPIEVKMLYKDIIKSISSEVLLVLPKYFGFSNADSDNIVITNLDKQAISNQVYTDTHISSNPSGDKFKYIWFAVPSNMIITSIKLPDALNAPLQFEFIKEAQTALGNYNLYKSVDQIDSTTQKHLIIS